MLCKNTILYDALWFVTQFFAVLPVIRGSQRDVVYLGWPIVPSYVSPNAGVGGGGGCRVSANEYSCAHGAQINFGDLTPYLTCACYAPAPIIFFLLHYSAIPYPFRQQASGLIFNDDVNGISSISDICFMSSRTSLPPQQCFKFQCKPQVGSYPLSPLFCTG